MVKVKDGLYELLKSKEKIILLILSCFFTPFFGFIISKWFFPIALSIIIIALLIIIIIVPYFLIRKRMECPYLYPSVEKFRSPVSGELNYKGVKWLVRTPIRKNRMGSAFGKPFVDATPRCPNCNFNLNESDKHLWYEWYCKNCGFKKRTWDCFYKSKEDLEKDRDLKKEKNKKKRTWDQLL